MAKGGVPQPIDLDDPERRAQIVALLKALRQLPEEAGDITPVLRRYPAPRGTYAKSQLLDAYRRLVAEGSFPADLRLERRLRGRPVRTLSGVAPVAILTRPYPCPGECIFCPNQPQAPKSYLDGEPGVLRALQNDYDPYRQTEARLRSLAALGHPVDKVELLILGGTWSYYPRRYRQTFLLRAFEVLNGEPSATLEDAHRLNETAPHRNVGLVIETRPDYITPREVLSLRQEGGTKVQIGAQSFDDRLLALNKRGHTVEDVRRAVRLLRLGGFKIVLHWMPNLYGATPQSDLQDFRRLWDDPALRPDELKIYPTALLEGTELYNLWRVGRYEPYDETTLVTLLIACKELVPPYCRINRLMRDIPANYIVAGVKKSNLRQIVQREMSKRGLRCRCIRCREVRGAWSTLDQGEPRLEIIRYETDATTEHFLQFLTPTGKLAGFLRLSLPHAPRNELPIPEIREVAMIREVHVYGPAQSLGQRGEGVQHRGLGSQLIERAVQIAKEAGFRAMAVIAAVGTRRYYRARGFTEGELYPIRRL